MHSLWAPLNTPRISEPGKFKRMNGGRIEAPPLASQTGSALGVHPCFPQAQGSAPPFPRSFRHCDVLEASRDGSGSGAEALGMAPWDG